MVGFVAKERVDGKLVLPEAVQILKCRNSYYPPPVKPQQHIHRIPHLFSRLSYYNIGDRGTRSFAELKELYAGNGMVGFVAKERVDGSLDS
mgnify:CR=1 FL=1